MNIPCACQPDHHLCLGITMSHKNTQTDKTLAYICEETGGHCK